MSSNQEMNLSRREKVKKTYSDVHEKFVTNNNKFSMFNIQNNLVKMEKEQTEKNESAEEKYPDEEMKEE